MEWRLNKYGLLFIFLSVFCMHAQTNSEEISDESDTVAYTDENSNFYPYYHYSEEEKLNIQNRNFVNSFDSVHWAKITEKMTFAEKKDLPEKKKRKKTSDNLHFSSSLKYLWLIPVLFILILLIVRLIPYIGQNNIKNKEKLLIHLENLDEEELKLLETEKALQDALNAGDYRLAYRLRYLDVLKKLMGRNLIVYKKEYTNYQYLTQLSNKKPYEAFRNLTFNFDGIWYGDLFPDKDLYESLDTHFKAFEAAMKNS